MLAACSPGAAPGGGEVFLAAAADAGPDPFTRDASNQALALGATSASPSSAPSGQVASVTGTSPRVYAGAAGQQPCDKRAIWDDLRSNDQARAAWAGVLGINQSQVEAYINGSAAVILRSDTRVTNHTLSGGRANPFQYVLQAGTAVLVDNTGLPRVRCACGNPLTPPVAVSGTVRYNGTQWPGFNPAILVVIVSGPPQTQLIVVQVPDGGDLEVPVATPGASASPSASAATSTPAPSPKPTGGTPTPANYTDCSQRYAQLVKELTLASKLTPADAQRWSAMAEDAAQAAHAGNLAEAYQICLQTVAEMDAALNA